MALEDIMDELGDFPDYRHNISRAHMLKRLLSSILGGEGEKDVVSEM